MNLTVKTLLQTGAVRTDAALERLLPGAETLPHSIHRAMRHSVFAGGKRLRPVLAIEAAQMVASSLLASSHPEAVTEASLEPDSPLATGMAELGAALEMLHTYSLIHDDLPALDNDDLRRGQPTCHILFGEATAILAGDALQTLAFQTLAQLPCPAETTVAILREVATAVGTGVGTIGDLSSGLPSGMIGGQVMDIEGEQQHPTAELVEAIHRAKTGALITVSIVAGGLYGAAFAGAAFAGAASGGATFAGAAGAPANPNPASPSQANHTRHHAASADTLRSLRSFGEKAGLAFQIVDDVLDRTQDSAQLGKTAGKDTASEKATWPAVFGIEQSLADANSLIADAFAELEPFGPAADNLKAIAQYLVERQH